MDGQRQQYFQPIPPPPPRVPAQLQHVNVGLPPPPPRPPLVQTGYTQQWQQPAYARQVMTSGYTLSPPAHPQAHSQAHPQHLPYKPASFTGVDTSYNPSAPYVPGEPPLTSATYVPGNETLGGFPPLYEPSHGRAVYDPYTQRPNGAPVYAEAAYNPQTPSGRPAQPFAVHGNFHELSNEHVNPSPQPSSQGPDLNKSPSHRHNTSGASLGGLSPSEAAAQWPLEKVLLWLAKNQFSKDWQDTFRTLELQGAEFLELGLASGGRGNLGKIHQVVYPQLAKECVRNGTGWDSKRERIERDEGLRIRRLIRLLHDGASDSSISTPLRQEPPFLDTGSGTFIREPRSAIEGTNDITSEQLAPAQNSKQNSGTRSFTQPNPAGHGSPYESPLRETSGRSEFSRNALSSALNDHRRQSPSISNEEGTFSSSTTLGGSTLRAANSPKSGSPAAQFASPYSGQAPSSSGDLPLRYEHSRGNSTDSIPGSGRGPSSAIAGRYYEHRKQGDGPRSSPQDSQRPYTAENISAREHSKGFFDRFDRLRKRTKGTDSSHPSPRESDLEPPSPGEHHYIPYSTPNFNNSDLSLSERSPTKAKKWILATVDNETFRLIDATEMETPGNLRTGICKKLGLLDLGNAQMFHTEPGQTDHDEPLNDDSLLRFRRSKSDGQGALKLLFVKGTQKTRPSPMEGLGVSISTGQHDKPALSPTALHSPIIRKPVADDAKISPQTQNIPSSPFSTSRQPTLKASGTPSGAQVDPLKDDLFARHEAYKREVERKQEENHISRHPPPPSPQLPLEGSYGENGYRSTKVIDFDKRRVSPFEEKKTSPYDDKKPESLVPFRKPPAAPNESTTLTKVNSLRKPPQTHGLGAALTSIGRITSAIGTPATSVNASSTPSSANRDSASSESDRPPTLGSAETASSRTTWGKFHFHKSADALKGNFFISSSHANQNSTTESSQTGAKFPEESPSEPSRRPSLQSRKSFGPEFVFEEKEVSFQRTPQPAEDSDSDDESDDGLFMVPLANKNQDEAEPEAEAPKDTLGANQKGPRVSFAPSVNPESSGGEASDSKDPRTFYNDVSPIDEKAEKRKSFVNDDVWASRPAVEGVIDNLDSFFPGVDLDAPYLDEPASPSSKPNHADDSISKGRPEHPPPIPSSSNDPTALYGDDVSTMRPQAGSKAVATRFINQSGGAGGNGGGGGLGRTKSIRQVARDSHRTKSVSAGPQKSGMLRRKSTKMFGAKIMQISPKPGSRISRLDPIPQQSTPQPEPSGTVPQRQPTFRIIRGQLIGKGTYGRVYLGMNADNGEVLAVKQVEINARIAGSDRDRIKEMVAALDQEIDTMQHLEHPNIVQYLGCERGETSISIYLEYISGGSIGSCLRKHGKFEECVVKSLTRQTLGGLAYLHDMGILHRDLKADNILLDLDGTCKISDFGISKKTDDIYGNDSSNSMQGSVFWMAPEVIQSQGQGYSAKVDIWSLGCVVLEMFAGRRPWSKEEAIGAIFKLGSLGQAPPIPDDVSKTASIAALSFMYDCFTVNSAERPTAGTLLTRHPFCESDPTYNFLDTDLFKKIGLPTS
ncbi:hypothetical protein N7456_008910 [Penicillium angulare]|uniref:Mitogen-activated protein kinase kinae kinase bck1 n=1 Tax=Penicillium angulare TaxID=116970 RepID=A0A9W9F3W2_9EURO|nr:hypothetical protein N7456_008910 [Penicillium angulare]